YIGRHGNQRVAKAVLIGAVPPLMLKTADNPNGTPLDVFDGIRKGVVDDRSQFFKDLAMPFYGYNRPGAKVSQGVIDSFWVQGMAGSIKGLYDCIKQLSGIDFTEDNKKITEVDYTEDMKKIDVPTLVLHGDDDQNVPIDAAGRLTAKIVKNATLKVYPGGQHGMCTVEAAKVNADLLEFIGS